MIRVLRWSWWDRTLDRWGADWAGVDRDRTLRARLAKAEAELEEARLEIARLTGELGPVRGCGVRIYPTDGAQ